MADLTGVAKAIKKVGKATFVEDPDLKDIRFSETGKGIELRDRKSTKDSGKISAAMKADKKNPDNRGSRSNKSDSESDSPKTLQAVLESAKANFQRGLIKSFQNPSGSALDDFTRDMVLGRGGFGVVVSVTHSKTHECYAMKMLSKKMVVNQKQVERSLGEKRLLQAINFPFAVNLIYFFTDHSYLYFLIPLAKRGDMYNYLRQSKRFSVQLAKFYAAQVVMALEYLHNIEVAFRDLKPENLVIFVNGYIKLTDFGCSKVITGRTYTMCGTPEYMAPEILKNTGYNRSVDWWAFGVLVYEMLVGYSPFEADDTKQTYEKILMGKIRFSTTLPSDARELIRGLIEPNLTRRLGNLHRGAADIKHHSWFEGCDWNGIFQQKVMPPAVPSEKQWQKTTEPYNPKEFKVSAISQYHAAFADFN